MYVEVFAFTPALEAVPAPDRVLCLNGRLRGHHVSRNYTIEDQKEAYKSIWNHGGLAVECLWLSYSSTHPHSEVSFVCSTTGK